jgi:CxxC motif-containing protein (DUF1111 family)
LKTRLSASGYRLRALACLGVLAAGCARGPDVTPLLQPQSGGAATVEDHTRKAFSRPAANLENASRAQFFIGNAFFNSPWVAAPASAGARDGLGALFNARSCDACHNNDGRGRPPESGQPPVSLVFQMSVPGTGPHGDPLPEPNYGGNLNPFAVDGLSAEGTVRIEHEELAGTFADGEPYSLLKPRYVFEQLAYGELAPDVEVSPRVAPAVIGSGLLEFVPEAQILEWEDPDDRDGDGISGRANRVWSLSSESVVLGRYGWKANQPDIAHQTAAAFNGEIGMTTTLRPTENCMPAQAVCNAAPSGGAPEISDEIFARIVHYQRALGVPSRRNLDSPEVRSGARLFLESGCAACHRPTLATAAVPEVPELANQTFHPFTDLLLHDMGPELADGRPDFAASGSEWRTPPLWGLGLQRTVNDHTFLLHDGRARNVTEAILWHGGEGEKAREAFRHLSRADREALLAFLDSL